MKLNLAFRVPYERILNIFCSHEFKQTHTHTYTYHKCVHRGIPARRLYNKSQLIVADYIQTLDTSDHKVICPDRYFTRVRNINSTLKRCICEKQTSLNFKYVRRYNEHRTVSYLIKVSVP